MLLQGNDANNTTDLLLQNQTDIVLLNGTGGSQIPVDPGDYRHLLDALKKISLQVAKAADGDGGDLTVNKFSLAKSANGTVLVDHQFTIGLSSTPNPEVPQPVSNLQPPTLPADPAAPTA